MTNTPFANVRVRLGLLIVVSLVSLVLGFVVVSPNWALTLVRHFGYWFVTAMVAGTVWFGVGSWRERIGGVRLPRVDWAGATVVTGAFVLMVVQYEWGLRVVMDEVLLLGASQYMHFDKEAYTPLRAYYLNGPFLLLGGYLDKRPLLFSTLLSYVHDLTGYRAANLFLLNGILGFSLLSLVYAIGKRLGGFKVGTLGVLLLASLPLLAQVMTGGGFDVLNLVVLCVVLLSGAAAVRIPTPAHLTFFVFSGLLLSQVRYETILFIVPVGLVVAWIWWRERKIVLSWPMIFAPLFVLPYVWQNKVFEVNGEFWQPKDKTKPDIPFSLDHLIDNTGHAVNFFFKWDDTQGCSLLITVPGFIAIALVLVLLGRRLGRLREETPVRQVFVFFLPFFVANVLVIMAHSWGQFDQYITHRLSLPFLLFLVFCVMFAIEEVVKRPRVWTLVYAGVGVFLLAYTIPTNAKGIPIAVYVPAREIMWGWDFAARQPDRNVLVIDGSPSSWIVQEVPSIGVYRAKEKRESLQFHLKHRTHREIFVVQRIVMDPRTGEDQIVEGDQLDPGFILEKVEEVSFVPLRSFRISRVVEILPYEEGKDKEQPPTVPRTALDPQTGERLEYLEEWGKNVP